MLNARAALWKEYCRLRDLVVKFVAGHELCRRFMQIPGVGTVMALSFMTEIERSYPVPGCGGVFWPDVAALAVLQNRSTCRGGSVKRAIRTSDGRYTRRHRRR
jgi:transposase